MVCSLHCSSLDEILNNGRHFLNLHWKNIIDKTFGVNYQVYLPKIISAKNKNETFIQPYVVCMMCQTNLENPGWFQYMMAVNDDTLKEPKSEKVWKCLSGYFPCTQIFKQIYKRKTAKLLKYWVVFLTKTGLSMCHNVLPLYGQNQISIKWSTFELKFQTTWGWLNGGNIFSFAWTSLLSKYFFIGPLFPFTKTTKV